MTRLSKSSRSIAPIASQQMKIILLCLVFLTSVTLSFGQTLWGMGENSVGQLGDGSKTDRSTPVGVASGVSAMAAGGFDDGGRHSLYLRYDGTLRAMGSNYLGQLGDGTTTDRSAPVQVASDVSAISAGGYHNLYLKSDGSLWGMGYNAHGQLGNRPTTVSTPVQVASGVSAISAGYFHSLYLKSDGTLWALGRNHYGQLGDGSITDRSTPIQVASGVSAISAGGDYSLYLKSDGTLWAMGNNTYGQLGDGSQINRSTPVQVASGVSAMSARWSHSLHLKSDGTLWAMGNNTYGQLGDGTRTNRVTPVRVASGVSATSAGLWHSFFVKNDSSLWAMGRNTFGQLGDGSITDRMSPVQIASDVLAVSAGNNHSFYLKKTNLRLSNLSVRTALDANQIVIVGVTMSGGAKNVLLRAAGPTLSAFGVPSVMADPKLDLYSGSTKVTTNDNWGGSTTLASAFQSVGAFAYSSTASLDAALVTSIDGGRTVQVSGPTAGTVLVEGYDAGSGDTQRFTNLSARNKVGTGANILIAGFTLTGSGTRNLLIRAVGPKLSDFGVTGVLTDPKLEIYSGTTKLTENDNWSSSLATTFSYVGAFGLTAGSKDAAIIIPLTAGGYTVQVSGADGGVGEALVEIYELP
jgi:alpha-tubulin suppressor-like RCC1 family protein